MTCYKLAYTQREAERALRHVQKRRTSADQRRRSEDHVYRCPYCHAWHMTSEPNTEGRRPRREPPLAVLEW